MKETTNQIHPSSFRLHPFTHALVEQSGVLATLSRWRPSVQIRSGVLLNCGLLISDFGFCWSINPQSAIPNPKSNGTVLKPVKRRSSNLRDCLWVRLPPVLLEQHASAGHW